MPGDHKDKKKKQVKDIRERLAKINKKVPQDKIRETPTKENNYQTHMDSKGEFEQRALKEKQKKAELTDRTKEHKQKQKKKDKLIHEARGLGVAPNYNNPSKVKKKVPQGPNPNAETADDILKNAEIASRKNDTYIAQLKQKIAEKRKKDYQKIEAEEKEEADEARKHKHLIEFRGHTGQYYKRASLVSSEGRYAKYWLLNAKQTNGNGWGVSQQSIAKNINKFIGRPLVVTAKSWVPESEYGDQFEHPYLPTNDINKVLDHQEKFRIGSIVDIIEKDGDYYANIEINQKFANMILPPFCSPAIFQNNPAEPEGQISDWEALHLAALMEDPAYGSRIALLRGTCIGTKDQCSVQFKSAKKEAKMVCTKGIKERIARIGPIDHRKEINLMKDRVAPSRVLEKEKGRFRPTDTDTGTDLQHRTGDRLLNETWNTGILPNQKDIKRNVSQFITEDKAKKYSKLKKRISKVKTSDQAIDDVIKDIKDPALKEDAIKRLDKPSVGPKNYSPSLKDKKKLSKLKQRLALEGGEGGVRKYWLYPDGKISEDVRWHDNLHFNDEGQMRDKGGVKITNEQGKYNNYFGVTLRQHLTPAQKSHIKQELKDYGFYRNKGNVTFDHGDNKNNTVDSTTKDFGHGFAHSSEGNQKPIGSQKISKLKQRLALTGTMPKKTQIDNYDRIIHTEPQTFQQQSTKARLFRDRVPVFKWEGAVFEKGPTGRRELDWKKTMDKKQTPDPQEFSNMFPEEAQERYYRQHKYLGELGEATQPQLEIVDKTHDPKFHKKKTSSITVRGGAGDPYGRRPDTIQAVEKVREKQPPTVNMFQTKAPQDIQKSRFPPGLTNKYSKLKQKLGNLSSFPNPKNSFTIRLKKGLTDIGWEPRYVNYAIQNQINQGWAKKYQTGTAQQFIRKNDLNTMDIYDANTGVNMKLGEIADVLPGTVEPRSGDTIFQRTGSPGKTQYFE